jgi:hypothetical protein
MMAELLQQAKELIGREVFITPLPSGRFIVEWFNYNTSPPPTGGSPMEALTLFIGYIQDKLKENPDVITTRTTGEDGQEDESLSGSPGE